MAGGIVCVEAGVENWQSSVESWEMKASRPDTDKGGKAQHRSIFQLSDDEWSTKLSYSRDYLYMQRKEIAVHFDVTQLKIQRLNYSDKVNSLWLNWINLPIKRQDLSSSLSTVNFLSYTSLSLWRTLNVINCFLRERTHAMRLPRSSCVKVKYSVIHL